MTGGVIVLGMHRSGTSVVTRVVNLLGLELGREDDLYHGPDNPGHWESSALIGCNARILRAFGGTGWGPPRLAAGWERTPVAESLLADMSATFSDVYDMSSPWVWKDPQTCLTLPLWRRVLPPVITVIVLRNPGQVIASLRRRDGTPYLIGLALWDRYTRSALHNSVGLPVVTVRFEDLKADPHAAVRQLRGDLEGLGVMVHGDTERAASAVGPSADGSVPRAVYRFSKRSNAAFQGVPRVTRCLSAPDIGAEPRWIKPVLTPKRRRAESVALMRSAAYRSDFLFERRYLTRRRPGSTSGETHR